MVTACKIKKTLLDNYAYKLQHKLTSVLKSYNVFNVNCLFAVS